MGSVLERMRKWWEEYLSRLSKANKESFGGGRIDCCGFGKATKPGKRR